RGGSPRRPDLLAGAAPGHRQDPGRDGRTVRERLPHAGPPRHRLDDPQAALDGCAALRLHPSTAGGPLASGADRLGSGGARDRALAVRPGVHGDPGPVECDIAGRGELDDRTAPKTKGGVGMKVDTYTESHVQCVLAEDERVAELGIRAIRLEEGGLALSGEVESQERRALIERVVAEKFPDLTEHCDSGVTRVHEPDEVEEL